MAKIAVVTGGTRGIGAAVARGLKAAGCTVAAIYHGNDEAAAKFKAETGVATYRWDVSDIPACAAGVKQVEASSARSTCWSTTRASRATRCSTR